MVPKWIFYLFVLCPLIFFSNESIAKTVKTNIDGVILKNVTCEYSAIWLNVSNRTNRKLSKRLHVTIFDSEGDPIDNANRFVSLGPVSGTKVRFPINCAGPKTYKFRFE